MPFQKGVSGNPAGRAPGSSYKENTIVRNAIHTILNDGVDKLRLEMNKLEGKDYLAAYIAMLEYVIPKKARIQVSNEDDEKVQEVIILGGQTIYF
jgi:hypothetical protein